MVMSSVVMFMVVISTAFASRYEGATLLQTQEFEHLQAAEGGRVEHLATMKQQILSFAETGVPANTLPLLATIKSTLEDDILPTILNETTQHNILHDRLKSAFSNAAATYNTEITDLGTVEGAAATAAKNEHTSCRVQEGVDWQQTSDCDVQQETAQGEYDTDETMLKRKVEQAAGVCVDNGYDWRNTADLNAHETNLQHYKDAVTALKGSRTVLETKIGECEGLEVERGTQQSLCDGKQTSYEESACTLSLGHQAANAAYTVTYETSKGLFEDEFDTWQEQSTDRENQCKLVKTLVCYITALEDHDDKAALNDAVNTCENNRDGHDCSSVTFTHEDTPVPITLTSVPVAPCDEQFDHGTFPTGTAKGECTPCSGVGNAAGAANAASDDNGWELAAGSWYQSMGGTCDQLCQGLGLSCNAEEQSKITTLDQMNRILASIPGSTLCLRVGESFPASGADFASVPSQRNSDGECCWMSEGSSSVCDANLYYRGRQHVNDGYQNPLCFCE